MGFGQCFGKKVENFFDRKFGSTLDKGPLHESKGLYGILFVHFKRPPSMQQTTVYPRCLLAFIISISVREKYRQLA